MMTAVGVGHSNRNDSIKYDYTYKNRSGKWTWDWEPRPYDTWLTNRRSKVAIEMSGWYLTYFIQGKGKSGKFVSFNLDWKYFESLFKQSTIYVGSFAQYPKGFW